MLNIGVIGYGYWGPNVVRNFSSIDGVRVASLCDVSPEALGRAERAYPHLVTVRDPREITASARIDAVCIVTPVSTHFELAKKALENGKHIFVEKPFTSTVAEAQRLIALAARKHLTIMVDHTFLFTSAVRKIKELIGSGALGGLYYYDSTRVNLGLFQHDVNVVWDLAPHDLSIMDQVIRERPVALAATGASHFPGRKRRTEDVAYLTVYFRSGLIAHFNVNWLSPVKIRMTMIGGEKRMLVWDDLEMDEKVKVYDKGVKVKGTEGIYNLLVEYRSGDMWAPRIDHVEALKLEAEYFVDCVTKNKRPLNDGHAGLRVVKMLAASDRSMKGNGRPVKL